MNYNINPQMQVIKIQTGEYLIKEGTMSNYSFELNDDKRDGMLDTLINNSSLYPNQIDGIIEKLQKENNQWDSARIKDSLKKLIEVNFLKVQGYTSSPVNMFIFEDHDVPISSDLSDSHDINICGVQNTSIFNKKTFTAQNKFSNTDVVLVYSTWYNPMLFYAINKMCIDNKKALIISYLDGNEGIIIPLINFDQVGCYNDFELLREASFHNLLDYQVAKENIIKKNEAPGKRYFNKLYRKALTIRTQLLLEKLLHNSFINYFAYDFDFERLVESKIKLIKFPKCPSCQGDHNLTHPFI